MAVDLEVGPDLDEEGAEPDNVNGRVRGLGLLPQHAALLSASAISGDVAAERGYRSVSDRLELARLGFAPSQLCLPALLIPVWGADGRLALHQARPDEPRTVRGKPVKYETVAGSRMTLDVHPRVRSQLGDPRVPLLITEGARKVDAAVSLGLCCIGLLGVWNWRGKNEAGGATALADWEAIALNGRDVYVAFDSDVVVKPSVKAALLRLKSFLQSRGARVRVIYLPAGESGEKVGLDDFIASGKGEADLLALAANPEERVQESSGPLETSPYEATDLGLFIIKRTRDGDVRVPLTNFTTQVLANVIVDDGLQVRRLVDLSVTLHGRESQLSVTADQFMNSSWVGHHLGAGAIVHPGQLTRDRLRVAAQLFSGEIPDRHVFAHTGWRETSDGWCYLHVGGAIGAAGIVRGVEVDLPHELSRFLLPEPPSGPALVESVRASLRVLDLCPDHITVPLLGAAWAAAMGGTDFSLHLAGPTGVFKTELAALIQQHWGSGMSARHLPGAWSGTGNALEALAFTAKDAVLVVDDFAPRGASQDIQRLHREADRLLRAQGNASGRLRLNADSALRPARPPRGLILSTGEDVPQGQSLRARILVLEIEPGTIDASLLSCAQRDAAAGLYAACLSAFIKWLAPQYAEIRGATAGRVTVLRDAAASSHLHRRTPTTVANLAVGWERFLRFAQETGGLGAAEAESMWVRCWSALGRAAANQNEHQVAVEPARRYLELLGAALVSGACHLTGMDGGEPQDPTHWGWRRRSGTSDPWNGEQWQSMGTRVGWVDGEVLFLDPGAAFAAAQRLARDQGEALAVTQKTLHKRLHEQGLLASVEDTRGTLTIRRVLGGVRRTVLHLRVASLMAADPDQPDQVP